MLNSINLGGLNYGYKKIELLDNRVGKTLTWVVMAAFILSTACTTTRIISSRTIEPQPDTLQNELKKGDLVNVTTKGGNSFKLRIAYLSSEAITGLATGRNLRELRILFTEIPKIEKVIVKKQASAGKTLGALVLVVLGGGLILGLVVLSMVHDDSMEKLK